VLDEPAASQSDSTVLELQLRAISKKASGEVAVRSIDNAASNPREIQRWITSISELHRSKPPPQVHYKKSMPDVEALMDVWPEEFEDALSRSRVPLPSVNLDLSLEEYIKVWCSLLDVPVYVRAKRAQRRAMPPPKTACGRSAGASEKKGLFRGGSGQAGG
jgi:intraflagellar transport protein 46